MIDLRSHDERGRTGVIPGSLHSPRSVLEWRLDPTSGWTNPHVGGFGRHLILMGAEGCSSSFAAVTARELGYETATDLDGGFEAWAVTGLPVRSLDPDLVDTEGRPGLGAPEPFELPHERSMTWVSR